jgi:hypothetical protein
LVKYAKENVAQWLFQPPSETRSLTVNFTYALAGEERYEEPVPRVVLELPNKVTITTNPAKVETSAGHPSFPAALSSDPPPLP